MATQLALHGPEASAVWDDRWRTIYEALGAIHVERATEVEFKHDSAVWEAVLVDSAVVIAAGPHRGEVIEREVQWLEKHWLTTNQTTKKENNHYVAHR